MKQTFPYIAPTADSRLVYTDGETMEEAVEAFMKQDYIESVHLLIDAMDFDFREKYGNADGTSFKIPHGSIVVNIDISDETLDISADFLKLPEKGRVAMLRQIAEMNINNLMLARFVKNGDRLRMVYSCPLTDTNPHKIYSVIRNICMFGDKYDDELCTRFDAERCYEPRITQYTDEEIDTVYNALHTIGSKALAETEVYNSSRRYGYSWTVLLASLYQFQFFAQPQGQLINELESTIAMMHSDRPADELVARCTEFLNTLLARPREELAKDLYSVEMLVSPKPPMSLQDIQEEFERLHDGTTGALQKKDFDQVIVRITYEFYQMLCEYHLPLMVEYIIVTALQKSAETDMQSGAETLWKALDRIMDGDLEPDGDDDEEEEEDDDDEDDDLDLDVEDDDEEDDEDDEIARQTLIAAQQKLADAVNSIDGIAEIQRKMEEAMKAGDVTEYMRLATELQMKIINGMNN